MSNDIVSGSKKIYIKSMSYSPNIKNDIKIIGAIIASLLITLFLTRVVFIPSTPKINQYFIASLPKKLSLLSEKVLFQLKELGKPIPTITPIPTKILSTISITPIPTGAYNSISPTKSQKIIPIIPTVVKQITPTNKPIPTIKPPTPTIIKPTIPSGSGSCPLTSSQSYTSMRAERSSGDLIFGNPETSPEINLHMRGFGPINESTGFISRGGSTYGLDDKQPPQISTLYGGPRPKIIKTYIVYEWDFDNNKSGAPNPATPNYKVTMIGLDTTPGQKLVGLQAGREIGGGNVFMVLYATQKDIVFTHSNSDTLMGGYLFFFLDICVDPNLLAKYNQDNAGGRSELPVIAPGQIFGYGSNTDAKVVVRDTMSFMDTRYNEDWWDY